MVTTYWYPPFPSCQGLSVRLFPRSGVRLINGSFSSGNLKSPSARESLLALGMLIWKVWPYVATVLPMPLQAPALGDRGTAIYEQRHCWVLLSHTRLPHWPVLNHRQRFQLGRNIRPLTPYCRLDTALLVRRSLNKKERQQECRRAHEKYQHCAG